MPSGVELNLMEYAGWTSAKLDEFVQPTHKETVWTSLLVVVSEQDHGLRFIQSAHDLTDLDFFSFYIEIDETTTTQRLVLREESELGAAQER